MKSRTYCYKNRNRTETVDLNDTEARDKFRTNYQRLIAGQTVNHGGTKWVCANALARIALQPAFA